jgi:hypothetical protein
MCPARAGCGCADVSRTCGMRMCRCVADVWMCGCADVQILLRLSFHRQVESKGRMEAFWLIKRVSITPRRPRLSRTIKGSPVGAFSSMHLEHINCGMNRCADVRMGRCADVRMNVRMCGCANVRMNVRMCRCADVWMCGCADVWMCRCAYVRM